MVLCPFKQCLIRADSHQLQGLHSANALSHVVSIWLVNLG